MAHAQAVEALRVAVAREDGTCRADARNVHEGALAISKVDEEEARRTFEILREMSQLDELEWMADLADAAEGVSP